MFSRRLMKNVRIEFTENSSASIMRSMRFPDVCAHMDHLIPCSYDTSPEPFLQKGCMYLLMEWWLTSIPDRAHQGPPLGGGTRSRHRSSRLSRPHSTPQGSHPQHPLCRFRSVNRHIFIIKLVGGTELGPLDQREEWTSRWWAGGRIMMWGGTCKTN